MMWKSIKPILPILAFTAVLNLLFIDDGETLVQWGILKVTEGGITTSLFMMIRIILLIIGFPQKPETEVKDEDIVSLFPAVGGG